MFDVGLGCFGCVVRCVLVVAVGQMCVVRGRFVFACFVMLCGFLVMARRVFVMLRCFTMMVRCLLRHKSPFERLHV
jgi:hypothetical protein